MLFREFVNSFYKQKTPFQEYNLKRDFFAKEGAYLGSLARLNKKYINSIYC